MLEQAISTKLPSVLGNDALVYSSEVYDEYIGILKGTVYYSAKGDEDEGPHRRTSAEDMRLFVQHSVAPALIRLFCVPAAKNFVPRQDVSSTAFTRYLYEHSAWIEDYFTFVRSVSGATPEVSLGEWSGLFSKAEVRELDLQLTRMPPPEDPAVAEEFNNLRMVVHSASENENFGLLLCVF